MKIRYHFGRSYRKRTVNICFAIILSYILAVNPVKESIPVQAAVTDNIGTAAIDQKLGTWDDTSETHSIIGLLRLIIEKLTTHLEKMDVLNAKMNALDTKIDLQTASLENRIDNSIQAANASYNLYVYIPKTKTLANYSGQQVKIISNSGNQQATATLQDDGTNYCATLYYNFSGYCKLSYNLLNHYGQAFSTIEPVTISTSSQEYQLADLTAAPANMSWHTIHSILRANLAAEFGLTNAGTVLPDNWIVVDTSTNNGGNALRIWRKTAVYEGSWSASNYAANAYYTTFNSDAECDLAYSSGLLSQTDITTGYLANNWHSSKIYWLSTAGGSGHLAASEGVYGYDDNIYSLSCFPYVWIN